MLPRASATDIFLKPVVNAATEFIGSTGLPAVFLLMVLESAYRESWRHHLALGTFIKGGWPIMACGFLLLVVAARIR
jgi:hypothetical protein